MVMKFEFTPPSEVIKARGKDARAYYSFFEGPSEMLEYMKQSKARKGTMYRVAEARMDFNEGKSGIPALEGFARGDTDEKAIEASAKMLSKFEELVAIRGSKFVIIDDVAGAIPNVPAYLAGHPLTMRRRQRVQIEQAPLVLVIDAAPSATVSMDQMKQRGIALLAIARLLTITRPLEIYVGTAVGAALANGKECHGVYTRIETSPLDLARACYGITGAAYPRGGCFEYIYNEKPESHRVDSLPWGFGDANLQRKNELELISQCFPGRDVFLVPAMFAEDPSLNNTDQWIRAALKKYGGEMFQDLAA